MSSEMTAQQVCDILCDGTDAVEALGGDGSSIGNMQVEQGNAFGLELARLLCSRAWTEVMPGSQCSKATFEVWLRSPKGKTVSIISSWFLGSFTIIEVHHGVYLDVDATERRFGSLAREPLPLDAPPPGARKRTGKARAGR